MKCFLFIFLFYAGVLFPIHADGTDSTITSKPVATEVSLSDKIETNDAQNIPQDENNDEGFISDLRPAAKLPLSPWIKIAISLIAFSLIIYIVKRFISNHKGKTIPLIVPIDPYTQALQSLEKTLQLIQRSDQRPFAFAITDAVRQYLASVFQLPAPECTTEEVLEKLPNVESLTDNIKDDIKNFLKQCDLAKFTQQKFDNTTRLKLYEQAKTIIQSADKLLHVKAEISNSSEGK